MKRILGYLVLWAFPLFCFGQDGIDAINDIKLSGKYFTAEATASTEDDAKKFINAKHLDGYSVYYCDVCSHYHISHLNDED